jgi:hypothetical protein
MPSHLGGFTSKSNEYHEHFLHKAQVLKGSKRILSTQTCISHKSHKPHKEVMGGAHKGLEMSVFRGWHQRPPKEGGGKILYLSPNN